LYGDVDLIYAGPKPTQDVKDYVRSHNNAKGHRGAHCERGARGAKQGDDWRWTGKPECTMFGATSTADAVSPQKFCPVCARLVTRQNLNPADSDAVLSFKSLLDS
jgi:hypothetical protein